MGMVFRAIDKRKEEAQEKNPYVAIKLLKENFAVNPDAFIALERETRRSQTLAHPNIVPVYDFDRDGTVIYMTMEYLVGSSLDKVIKSPALKRIQRTSSTSSDVDGAELYPRKRHRIAICARKYVSKPREGDRFRHYPRGCQSRKNDRKTVFDAGRLNALTPPASTGLIRANT
jgi:hypothetical protein